jgi:hypothetical protein
MKYLRRAISDLLVKVRDAQASTDIQASEPEESFEDYADLGDQSDSSSSEEEEETHSITCKITV